MASSSSSSSKRHPVYHGIRCRRGKWVTEIREPRKDTRIWLGTYPTPEMAAAAYDVAALALKGSGAVLNFPDSADKYPVPASKSPADIRSAATAAAQQMEETDAAAAAAAAGNTDTVHEPPNNIDAVADATLLSETEFMDEEAIFFMPNLLIDMAEGMLLSPPRINPPPSPDNSGGESLWNYF